MKEILMENKNMNADICEACGRIIRTQTFNGMTIRMMCECKREKIEAEKQIELQKGYDIIKEDVFSDNGISKKYSGITLEKITHVKGQENAISIAKRFLANYAKNSQIKGFALGGGVGSGKTFIVAALVNQFCELWLKKVTDYEKSEAVAGRLKAKAPIRFISHIELLESLKSNSELITKYKKAKIFVIDDLGAARNTEWAEERLFEIIDFRYNEELPTIFTTNLTSEELKEKISNRIYDRLLEMCDFVGVTAPSQRLRVAKNG